MDITFRWIMRMHTFSKIYNPVLQSIMQLRKTGKKKKRHSSPQNTAALPRPKSAEMSLAAVGDRVKDEGQQTPCLRRWWSSGGRQMHSTCWRQGLGQPLVPRHPGHHLRVLLTALPSCRQVFLGAHQPAVCRRVRASYLPTLGVFGGDWDPEAHSNAKGRKAQKNGANC